MTHDWHRLGAAVKARRVLLRLTQLHAAVAAEVSIQTWVNIERGNRVRELTLAGIDHAMRWEPGSAESVLAGGEPIEIPDEADEALDGRVAYLEAELAEVKAALAAEDEEDEEPTEEPTAETWSEQLDQVEAEFKDILQSLRRTESKLAVLKREQAERERREREQRERREREAG